MVQCYAIEGIGIIADENVPIFSRDGELMTLWMRQIEYRSEMLKLSNINYDEIIIFY